MLKFTEEHQKRLYKHCAKWKEKILNNNKQITFEEAKNAIDYLYEFVGQTNKPFIIIMDSFHEAQLAANHCALINLNLGGNQVRNQVWNQVWAQVGNQVENQVRNQVGNQVRNQVWAQVGNQVGNQVENQVENQVRNQVRNQVGNQVENQVRNQVGNQVRNQVWAQVGNQVRNQVGNQVENQVRNQVGNQVENQVRNQVGNQVRNQEKVFFGQYYFGLFYESYWLTFYNFWIDEKVINNDFIEKWTFHLMNGIYNIIILENFVIITRNPKQIKRDNQDRLHSVETTAIYDQHYIHGVFFEETLWEKVSKRQLTPKEVMQMKNIEQRRVTINHYGWDEIFDYFDKKLINKSKRNSKAELYRVKGLAENIEINIVKYKDPSTERWYVSQVPDEDDYNEKILTADHAMAWKSFLTLPEYEQLYIEA